MVIDTSNPIIWKAKADVSEFKASLAYSTECVPAGATQRSPGWKEWKKKKKNPMWLFASLDHESELNLLHRGKLARS